MHLNRDEFGELVDEALSELPQQFDRFMENVIVEVRDVPDAKLAREINLPPNAMLLGLYRGIPMTRKSVWRTAELPEQIYIFQRNIEAVCSTRQQIVIQVRKTVLHEIGHHFGFGEKELRELGY